MRLQPSNYWGLSGACLHQHLLLYLVHFCMLLLSWLENAELFRAKTLQSPRTGDDNICIELLLRGRGGESQNLSGHSQNRSSVKPFDWKKKWNREIAAENSDLRTWICALCFTAKWRTILCVSTDMTSVLCLCMHRCGVWCTDMNAANKSHMLLVAITALCFVILISSIGEVPTNLPQIRLRWKLKLTEKMEQGNSSWTCDTFVFEEVQMWAQRRWRRRGGGG